MAKSKQRTQRKLQWMEAGIAALSAQQRQTFSHYMCPLCLLGYDDPDALTLEHVPPRSIGGKEICLTCVACNETAGHSIDAEVYREHVHRNFLAEENAIYRATIHLDKAWCDVDIVNTGGGGVHINVVGKINDPRRIARFQEELQEFAEKGTAFEAKSSVSYKRSMSDIGHLKSAYLAAFAKFGYAFILRTQLHAVREQIANPRQLLIPTSRLFYRESKGLHRKMLIMTSPVKCLGVRINDSVVCLPWMDEADDVYTSLDRRRQCELKASVTVKEAFSWPTTCEYLLDHLQESPHSE